MLAFWASGLGDGLYGCIIAPDFGIPDWETGVQEIEWVVPDDLSGVRFACTVPGHYFTMQGDFVVSYREKAIARDILNQSLR